MDTGGLNWFVIDVVGFIVLGAALLWGIMKVRSRGRETSTKKTEEATDRLYKEEEAKRRAGTDDDEA